MRIFLVSSVMGTGQTGNSSCSPNTVSVTTCILTLINTGSFVKSTVGLMLTIVHPGMSMPILDHFRWDPIWRNMGTTSMASLAVRSWSPCFFTWTRNGGGHMTQKRCSWMRQLMLGCLCGLRGTAGHENFGIVLVVSK